VKASNFFHASMFCTLNCSVLALISSFHGPGTCSMLIALQICHLRKTIQELEKSIAIWEVFSIGTVAAYSAKNSALVAYKLLELFQY